MHLKASHIICRASPTKRTPFIMDINPKHDTDHGQMPVHVHPSHTNSNLFLYQSYDSAGADMLCFPNIFRCHSLLPSLIYEKVQTGSTQTYKRVLYCFITRLDNDHDVGQRIMNVKGTGRMRWEARLTYTCNSSVVNDGVFIDEFVNYWPKVINGQWAW